eukprot:1350008-Amorphochlora_amoeboformis.AAC.1
MAIARSYCPAFGPFLNLAFMNNPIDTDLVSMQISEGELQVDARDIPPGSFSNFFWLFSGGDSIRAKVWGTNRIESTRYTL